MKHLFYAFSLASIALLSSCGVNVLHGEGKKTTETPSVGDFSALDISVSSNVYVTVAEGSGYGIELSGYENIIKHIKTEVKGKTLHITYDLDDTWSIEDDDLNIRVSVPALTGLAVSGAPDVDIRGNVKGEELDIDVSGACTIKIENLNTERLVADLSGVSGLEIKGGSVKTAKYEISGAGKIEAFGLQTEETNASISGTGKSEVTASRRLEADISGAGVVRYKGNPEVEKHISGVGTIKAED